MELKQLEYFRAVANAGGFSQASAELMVVQPALSRQIARLEEEVGAKLFYRNGRGVTLTDAGTRFLQVVARTLDDLTTVRRELRAEQAAPRGTVRLGMPPSVSGMIGASLLMRMRRAYPEIKLHIMDGLSGHICDWMIAGKIDVGIIHEARQSSGLIIEHLLSESLYVVGRPAPELGLPSPQGTLGTISLADIARLPLVLQGQTHGMRRLIDRVAAEEGVGLNIDMEIDAIATIIRLVQCEPLYGIVPIGCALDQLYDGNLCAWRIVHPTLTNVMLLATAPNTPFTPAMREVRKAIQSEIAALRTNRALSAEPYSLTGLAAVSLMEASQEAPERLRDVVEVRANIP
ncbi:LysR family transcriptional regulator [Acuticoccus kandeliae]|uniref:LysR family transcriptional regulator n=1 Tax=Acuticoccus kandeliae TaxID=2073160 RepID=UPI001473AA10|nr:LysR substrate-binding domain-containing protein [Acuticoccus kandeliae]